MEGSDQLDSRSGFENGIQFHLPSSDAIASNALQQIRESEYVACKNERISQEGNPRTPLKPLLERSYTKKIYVGNLREDITTEEVIENVKRIYQEED